MNILVETPPHARLRAKLGYNVVTNDTDEVKHPFHNGKCFLRAEQVKLRIRRTRMAWPYTA